MKTHLIFDLGGTLIFDPFDDVVAQFAGLSFKPLLEEVLGNDGIPGFLKQWHIENREYNFPFASHFLQEEPWITRAAWPYYHSGTIADKERFALWTTRILHAYRATAFASIRNQGHLGELRQALVLAKSRGYKLSVASNDRYFATSAMLQAAGIIEMFDLIATSEELSFDTPGAEKPSVTFFKALQGRLGLDFENSNTFYIGDDEARDILATNELPLRSIRFLGNKSQSKSWLDNRKTTRAHFKFEKYSELSDLINSGTLEE